jgi:dTDP-4-amino-4,6-dideoxygalactose transaminase
MARGDMNDLQLVKPVIPINDLKRVFGSNATALTAATQAVLASGWWLNGQENERFCAEFAEFLGTARCIGVANGTDALEIAMRALLNVREPHQREVITVANAGGYSTIACRLLGLVPVYADIEERTQLANLDSVLSSVSEETAFVVATHLYGGPLNVPRLREMLDQAGRADIPILEDCAQAHGASVRGAKVGSLGKVAAFSFYPTKNLGALGDAGAIATSDQALADAVASLRQYGWGAKYRVVDEGGRNSRMDEVQAAALRVLLPGLAAGNARRRDIIRRYAAAAPSGIAVVDAGEESVGHLAIVLCDKRDALLEHMKSRGVATDVHYPILDCDQPAWRDLPFRTAPDGLPVSRKSVERILTLPCFPDLTDDEVDRVCAALSEWPS